MAYTPAASFTFAPGSYAPGATFNFNTADPQAALNVTTDNALLNAVAEISLYKSTFDVTTDSGALVAQSALAPQSRLIFTAQTYAPTALFDFNESGYTPSTAYNFTAQQATLDDAILSAACNYYDNGAVFNVAADNATLNAAGHYIQNRAAFSVTTDEPGYVAPCAIVPQSTFSVSTDDATLNASAKNIQNRAVFNVAADELALNVFAINVPQASFFIGTDNVALICQAVNAPRAIVSVSTDNNAIITQCNFVDNYAAVHITTDNSGLSAVGLFDYNTTRYMTGGTESRQQNATLSTLYSPIIRNQSTYQPMGVCALQMEATPLSTKHTIDTDASARLDFNLMGDTENASRVDNKTCFALEQMTPVHVENCTDTRDGTPRHQQATAVSEQMTQIRGTIWDFVKQDSSNTIKVDMLLRYSEGDNPYTPNANFVFDGLPDALDSRFEFTGFGYIEFIQQHWNGTFTNVIDSDWQYATPLDVRICSPIDIARRPPPGISVWIDPPRPDPDPDPDHLTVTVPTRSTYHMQHTISVTLLDGTPIDMGSIKPALDADSFAYTFSGNLRNPKQLPLLKQTTADPVQLMITVNGVGWHMLVEKITRGRVFGKNTITVSGRGLSALLGQPYQQPTSVTQNSALSVQQIADLQLPVGWTIVWNMPTWLVPSGAYTHTNATPIQAIKQLAENIGAVVVPHRTQKVLTIQPRYPVLPWHFFDVAPDVIIPESVIPALSERPVLPEQANGVYVHGAEVGGQIGFCRLNGTAGDKLAQTESNALMTDPYALRALGERVLAGNATQPVLESMTLPMDNVDVPMLEIGQLIEITYEGVPVRGIVNSIACNADFGKVRQTLQLGEETSNTWTRFKNLLPADPMLLGTLSSTDGTTSLMTLLGGGVVRVRGTGVVNQKYYIRSGRIDGDAPGMVQSEIVV